MGDEGKDEKIIEVCKVSGGKITIPQEIRNKYDIEERIILVERGGELLIIPLDLKEYLEYKKLNK